MDKEKYNILNEFYRANKNKCLALKNWIEIKGKDFKLIDALNCIYDEANGKTSTMNDIIDHLINFKKTNGRTQVYADDLNKKPHIDIISNNGKLELINYNSKEELNKKGQKVKRNPNIFRKKDGQIKKTFQKKEEILVNIGDGVRQLFPTEDKETLENIINAVSKYSQDKKIGYKTVLLALQAKRLVFDPRLNIIRSSANENKIVIITESMFNELKESDDFKMTEYKFNSNIKHFLSELLSDPVNAEPSILLRHNGLNRSRLINLLINNEMLVKDEQISDKDENGELKTATMKVKFKVPKADFKHKLKKLYIKLFERNTPSNNTSELIGEDGEGAFGCGATGADNSGAFEQPVFGIQRRKISSSIDETDTNSVGNYEYDVPMIGDKETLARKNGIGGSVSMNRI